MISVRVINFNKPIPLCLNYTIKKIMDVMRKKRDVVRDNRPIEIGIVDE